MLLLQGVHLNGYQIQLFAAPELALVADSCMDQKDLSSCVKCQQVAGLSAIHNSKSSKETRRDKLSIEHATQDSHSTTTVPLVSQQAISHNEATMRPVPEPEEDPANTNFVPLPGKGH